MSPGARDEREDVFRFEGFGRAARIQRCAREMYTALVTRIASPEYRDRRTADPQVEFEALQRIARGIVQKVDPPGAP